MSIFTKKDQQTSVDLFIDRLNYDFGIRIVAFPLLVLVLACMACMPPFMVDMHIVIILSVHLGAADPGVASSIPARSHTFVTEGP